MALHREPTNALAGAGWSSETTSRTGHGVILQGDPKIGLVQIISSMRNRCQLVVRKNSERRERYGGISFSHWWERPPGRLAIAEQVALAKWDNGMPVEDGR